MTTDPLDGLLPRGAELGPGPARAGGDAARGAPGGPRRRLGAARSPAALALALLHAPEARRAFVVRVDNTTGIVDVVPVYRGGDAARAEP